MAPRGISVRYYCPHQKSRWLLIDILTAPNRARIIHRAIDGIVGLLAHLVERFRMGVFRRSFLILSHPIRW